jgi:hypothetical protein
MNVNTRNIHHHNQQHHHQGQHHQQQPQRHSNSNNTNHLNHNHGVGHHQVNTAPNRGAAQHVNNMNGGSGGVMNRNVNRPHPNHAMQGAVNTNNNHHNPQTMAPQRQTQPQQQQQRMNQAHRPGAQSTAPNVGPNTQPPSNNMPPPPQVLPKGWKKEEVVRTKGISAGIVDVVYAPSAASEASNPALMGKKFRNKLELHRFFGDKYDMSLLDYKSGKVSQIAWRKQRRLKSMATNIASACKYDNYLNLPIRQTASIFKQPVSVVTNNHKNEPTPAHILNANAPPQTGNTNAKPSEKPKPVQVRHAFHNLILFEPLVLKEKGK